MSGSGISWAICKYCTSLQTDNHASTPPLCFLQAGCPSCHPTKALKAQKKYENRLIFGEVMGKSLVSCFFWLTVYMASVVYFVSAFIAAQCYFQQVECTSFAECSLCRPPSWSWHTGINNVWVKVILYMFSHRVHETRLKECFNTLFNPKPSIRALFLDYTKDNGKKLKSQGHGQ